MGWAAAPRLEEMDGGPEGSATSLGQSQTFNVS
jgi:hypothetical protein